MRLPFLLLFLIIAAAAPAQPPLSSGSDDASFANVVVKGLPEAAFYFIGQLHNNEANVILEKEILFSLNRRFGATYDILEYSHSAAVIVNEYLRTGDDALLSFTKQEAEFSFIRAVKKFNDSLSGSLPIKFYGIDFEGRHGGKYTRKAIAIILQQVTATGELSEILRQCEKADSIALSKHLRQLKNYIDKNSEASRKAFGERFTDIYLIANAAYGFSPNRDRAMYHNFKFLYNELSIASAGVPKFFASFGIGHVNPGNGRGLANLLLESEDSPIRSSVSILGVQYINCSFGNKDDVRKSVGMLSFVCPQKRIATLESGNSVASFRFLPVTYFNYCQAAIGKLNGIIVIENYKATTHWTWE